MLEIPLDSVYEQTIRQFGPLLISRTKLLSDDQLKCLFACCCNVFEETYGVPFEGAVLPGRWKYVEEALWAKNYLMWKEACKWVR